MHRMPGIAYVKHAAQVRANPRAAEGRREIKDKGSHRHRIPRAQIHPSGLKLETISELGIPHVPLLLDQVALPNGHLMYYTALVKNKEASPLHPSITRFPSKIHRFYSPAQAKRY